jgi:hypothetical protein
MTTTAAQAKAEEIARRFGRDAVMLDSYNGSRLATTALDAISTWDVSSHAQRERARLGVPDGLRSRY